MKWKMTKAPWLILGIVVILAAGSGMTAHFYGCRHLPRRLLLGTFSKHYVPGPDIEFLRLSTGHGQGPRGSDFEIFEFRSSDCVEIADFYHKFHSPEDAREEMMHRITDATRVLSPTSQISTDNSYQEGERAVVLSGGEYVVLRRVGNNLHTIASSSLNHTLEFEKRGHFELEVSFNNN